MYKSDSFLLQFHHQENFYKYKKGKLFLFNFKNFHPSTRLPDRKGSDIDVKSVTETFSSFNFQIEHYESLKLDKFLDRIDISKLLDYLIFFILYKKYCE